MAAFLPNDLHLASKRSRSQLSLTPLQSVSSKQASRATTPDIDAKVPAFLRQTRAEIQHKFRELNWQEKTRIVHGRTNENSRWAQDPSPSVIQRNRYLGVQPWDKSRIRLRVPEGALDYINASPVVLKDPRSGVETKYIASQGPKKSVLSHFWQMVRHETGDVAVIVMLTPTEEAGREKCYQYFPLDATSGALLVRPSGHENDNEEGQVSFVEKETTIGRSTLVRKLHLSFGDQTKVVWHLLFTAFPDFGVPEDEDRAELLQLIKMADEKNSGPQNPKIIHCSAGVGRTGTFIALEYLLSQLNSGAVAEAPDNEDMVQDVVHRLREQRMMMVQMDNQFEFLYDVLREEYEKKLQRETEPSQPSPKIRKVQGGGKEPVQTGSSQVTVETEQYRAELQEQQTALNSKETEEEATNEDKAPQPGFWRFVGRPFAVITGTVMALFAGTFWASFWSSGA